MRATLLACTCLAALLATSASGARAQSPTPPAAAFMNSKDIMALVEKAKADIKPNAPTQAEPILLLAPYRAQLEYRPGTGPAALHEADAELMVVLDGTGDIVTGGTLVNEKRTNASNRSGTSIKDGTSHKVAKGDMILIPANSPHQVIPGGGAPIVLMTMHTPFPPKDWPARR
jgi:mannose-6-phosphate isomerase-like protein (cupin superfamily)